MARRATENTRKNVIRYSTKRIKIPYFWVGVGVAENKLLLAFSLVSRGVLRGTMQRRRKYKAGACDFISLSFNPKK